MGRVRRRLLVVPLLAGLVGVPAVPPAAAATGGHVVYALDTHGSGSETFDAATGDTVTATYSTAQRSVRVVAQRPDGASRELVVWPDASNTVAVGTFTVGSGVWMSHPGCFRVDDGTVAISELTRDAAGELTTLALSYDATCDRIGRRVTGTVRYHSDAPWQGVRTASAGQFGGLPGSTHTRTVTVTGTGPAPVTLGAATVSTTSGTPAFTVTGNACAGVTLTAGESCDVTLSFAPTAADYFRALLSVAADTPRGAVLHVAVGRGVRPPAAPRDVRAVAGDDGIGVSWAQPALDWAVPNITGYRVYRDGGAEPVASVTQQHYVDPAAPGETHTYSVAAVAGDAGEGAPSAAHGATVPSAPTEGTGPVTGVAWWTPEEDAAAAAPEVTATPGTLRLRLAGSEVVVRPVSGSAWGPGTVHADLAVVNGCAASNVPLSVAEARVRADGTPVTLALSGQIPCGTATLHVDVRYAATTPLHAPDTTPDRLWFARTAPGGATTPVRLTVANHGSGPLELGAPVVPPHWTVSANTCALLAPGASCTLDVAFTPTAPGDHDAVLTIPDNTPRGRRTVTLFGESLAVPSPVRNLRATPLLGRVVLTFDPPEHEYPLSARFVAQRSTSPTGPWSNVVVNGRSRHLVDPYAGIGQRLYYRVRAENSEGWGPYARTEVVTTGRELVYTADTGTGRYHLTGRGLPGTGPVRLTTTVRDEEDPAFSPDRTKLAYTREDVAGRWFVYRATAFGQNVRKVAGDVSGVPWTYRNPRWSPDGGRLAYACRPVTRTYWDLCVKTVSTGTLRVVPGVLQGGGSWLPNGKELVVVAATSPPKIQVVAYDNSYRVGVVGTSEAREVALSPDGSRIAWTRYEGTEGDPATGGGARRSLRVSPLSGGFGVVIRSTGYVNDPDWSPDGATVYFTHGERTPGVPLTRDVWSAKATGGGLVNHTASPDVDEDNVTIRDGITRVETSPQAARPMADFTGDGKAEIAVFRPGTGAWRIRGLPTVVWGRIGDIPVAADYTGDRKADRAVFRPSDGTWRIYGRAPVTYGRRGDVPVPADYDGDGRTDIAVFRPSDGTWRIRGRTPVAYGTRGDVPVPADYNGDRKADIAVFRPDTGTWLVRGRARFTWYKGDPVPADYLGRGRAEHALLSGGDWFVSSVGVIARVPRTLNDVPAYGNFNGDRRVEPAVVNPTLGLWRVMGQRNVLWGIPGDIPV